MLDQLQSVNSDSINLFSGASVIGIFSLLAWGFGYVGQPHILARFMAIENPQKLAASRRIAMVWMIIVLSGSVLTGLAGMAYFVDEPLANSETVFIVLSQSLFNPWIAGVITAAILSAIMSTIDSQLLVSSSVISEDLYRVYLRPQASEKELLWISRLAVVGIAVVALIIASDRNSRVLDLVSYAWAGFGASFGPVIVFSLFWRKMTAAAAIIGMLLGAVTVVVWSNLSGGLFDLYEIVPGFLFASIAIVVISQLLPEENQDKLSTFEHVQLLNSSE